MSNQQNELDNLANKNNEELENFRSYLKDLKGITINDLDIENLDNRIVDLLDSARALGYAQAVFNWK